MLINLSLLSPNPFHIIFIFCLQYCVFYLIKYSIIKVLIAYIFFLKWHVVIKHTHQWHSWNVENDIRLDTWSETITDNQNPMSLGDHYNPCNRITGIVLHCPNQYLRGFTKPAFIVQWNVGFSQQYDTEHTWYLKQFIMTTSLLRHPWGLEDYLFSFMLSKNKPVFVDTITPVGVIKFKNRGWVYCSKFGFQNVKYLSYFKWE